MHSLTFHLLLMINKYRLEYGNSKLLKIIKMVEGVLETMSFEPKIKMHAIITRHHLVYKVVTQINQYIIKINN